MRGCKLFLVVVGITGFVLSGAWAQQGVADADTFTSVKQAYTAWQGAADAATKETAFAWMEARARTCPPQELAEALSSLRLAAVNDGRGGDFLAVCTARSAVAVDAAERHIVALQLSDWHTAAGDHAAAAAALTDHLAVGGLPSDLRAAAARKAATILADRLGRPADAAAILTSAMPPDPSEDPASFADLAVARAALLHGPLDDPDGAAAEAARVLALGSACPIIPFAAAAERLASVRAAAGMRDKAADTILLIFRHPEGPQRIVSLARKLIDTGASVTVLEEALGLLRAAAAAPFKTPAELQTRVERLQTEAVEVLLALGRPEEAVRECRALVFAASDRFYPQAVELAARGLKALDGDLGRANALLAFHAPDAPPDVANPLLAFPPLDDPTRVGVVDGSQPAPGDWQGWLNHAVLLAWADRPAAAMEAGCAAFAGCPMTSNILQNCADAVARPVLVATRDAALGQRLADFLLHGPVGPDGVTGTKDDLDDPFPEARRRLAYAAAAAPAKALENP